MLISTVQMKIMVLIGVNDLGVFNLSVPLLLHRMNLRHLKWLSGSNTQNTLSLDLSSADVKSTS